MNTTEIIKRIRKIEIITRGLVNEIFSGEYHSLFKGQGLEFSEVREYQDGDSFRQIDWNVSARMGYPYIKKFEETRELNVMFLVDNSSSTLYGTRDYLKSEYITEVAAVLSFSALSNNDKVGMCLFTDEVEKYIPPRKGRKSALRMLRDILFFEPQNKTTNIGNAIEYIYQLIKKKSIIFVISDFIDDQFDDKLKLLAKKHDVVALRIVDPTEIELPDVGIIRMEDPETGHKFTVNTSNKRLRKKINNQLQDYEEKIEARFKKMMIDLITIKTTDSYATELRKFFKKRIKRKNH